MRYDARSVRVRGCNDETDFSTEQSRAHSPPRLPGAHGDQGRPQGDQRAAGQGPQAPVSLTGPQPARLKRRGDFKRVARGVKAHKPFFTLQARERDDGADEPRLGFTVTKKVGNAVVRNRIKRRLRALAAIEADAFSPSVDYVFIARRDAYDAQFADMRCALAEAVRTANAKLKRSAEKMRA